MSLEVAESIGIDGTSVRQLAHTWHLASRQALFSGGFESRPRLLQIAVFLATQVYWLCNKEGESLNSSLGQAVRNAQSLRMDRDIPGANALETHMQRRLWWELWCCHTFQSLCFGRAPLIHADPTRVPFATNCDDVAATESSVNPRPLEDATDLSASIARAKLFQILHGLYKDGRKHMGRWDYVRALYQQVEALLVNLPWFFRHHEWEEGRQPETRRPSLIWQHYILHCCARLQQMRMVRPFWW